MLDMDEENPGMMPSSEVLKQWDDENVRESAELRAKYMGKPGYPKHLGKTPTASSGRYARYREDFHEYANISMHAIKTKKENGRASNTYLAFLKDLVYEESFYMRIPDLISEECDFHATYRLIDRIIENGHAEWVEKHHFMRITPFGKAFLEKESGMDIFAIIRNEPKRHWEEPKLQVRNDSRLIVPKPY